MWWKLKAEILAGATIASQTDSAGSPLTNLQAVTEGARKCSGMLDFEDARCVTMLAGFSLPVHHTARRTGIV